jgi:hypothetical protein
VKAIRRYPLAIILATLVGSLLALVLHFMGHNPLYGFVIAALFSLWLINPANPYQGRLIGFLVGVISGTLLSVANLLGLFVLPPFPGVNNPWLAASLNLFLLGVGCAVYADLTVRVRQAYFQGTGPFF